MLYFPNIFARRKKEEEEEEEGKKNIAGKNVVVETKPNKNHAKMPPALFFTVLSGWRDKILGCRS